MKLSNDEKTEFPFSVKVAFRLAGMAAMAGEFYAGARFANDVSDLTIMVPTIFVGTLSYFTFDDFSDGRGRNFRERIGSKINGADFFANAVKSSLLPILFAFSVMEEKRENLKVSHAVEEAMAKCPKPVPVF